MGSRKSQDTSEKKEEAADQFFSVVDDVELDNGRVMIEREEKYNVYRRVDDNWEPIQELQRELINGDEIAACLRGDKVAEVYFKVNYLFK